MLSINQQRARDARDLIYRRVKHLGPIKWHNNRSSFYIKFRDTRIGSIRISNHVSNKIYSYKWNVLTDLGKREIRKEVRKIISEVIEKAAEIDDFDPKKYRVYCTYKKRYLTLANKEEYNEYVLNGILLS